MYATVLTGPGDGFCAGADVTAMPDRSGLGREAYGAFLSAVQAMVERLRTSPTPTIALIPQHVGTGRDFALAYGVLTVGPDALFREGQTPEYDRSDE